MVTLAPSKWGLGEWETLLAMIGFDPTGKEQAAILKCRKKYKLVVGGEQAGKSMEASADFILHLAEDLKDRPGEPLLYWLVAADYDRTKAEFAYIADFLTMIYTDKLVVSSKRVDPGLIEVWASEADREKKPWLRIETKSGKDPRTLAMFAPNGIIGCEASQLDLDTHFKIMSRLSPKNGWLHYAGTYEGTLGWYPGLAAAWRHGTPTEQSFILPSPSNFHFYPGGINDEKLNRLRAASSDDFFNERILGIAAPPNKRVFRDFRPDVHIREVKYNPDLHVNIGVDPGFGHPGAIEVWQEALDGQLQVFYEVFERGVIMEDMIERCLKQEWWKNPNKYLAIDPNYSQQHHGALSMADVWLAKTGLTSQGPRVKVAERVERLKSFLRADILTGMPGIVFDPSCKGILSELGAWPDPFDGQARVYSNRVDSQGNNIGNDPDPKWDDGCSALMYSLVERRGLVNSTESEHAIMTRRRPLPLRRRILERIHR